MPLLKKPAAVSCGTMKAPQGPHVFIYPGNQCGVCNSQLYTKFHEAPVECTIVSSETFETACTLRKECKQKYCVHAYRATFAYIDSVKVNTMSLRELEDMKVYMVTNGFGFTMKYLQMCYFRLLRGNLAPGQETSVRAMLEGSLQDIIHPRTFRTYLVRALEGYALAQRTLDVVVPFPIDDPTSFLPFTSTPMTFKPSKVVKILSFDGHFGLNRQLNST